MYKEILINLLFRFLLKSDGTAQSISPARSLPVLVPGQTGTGPSLCFRSPLPKLTSLGIYCYRFILVTCSTNKPVYLKQNSPLPVYYDPTQKPELRWQRIHFWHRCRVSSDIWEAWFRVYLNPCHFIILKRKAGAADKTLFSCNLPLYPDYGPDIQVICLRDLNLLTWSLKWTVLYKSTAKNSRFPKARLTRFKI